MDNAATATVEETRPQPSRAGGRALLAENIHPGAVDVLSAAGFEERFVDTARGYGGRVITWSLEDVYAAQ